MEKEKKKNNNNKLAGEENEEDDVGHHHHHHPMRYLPIRHVYSSTASPNPKKVKAHQPKPPLVVYDRRRRTTKSSSQTEPPLSFFDSVERLMKKKRPRELLQLGGSDVEGSSGGPRLRTAGRNVDFSETRKRRRTVGPDDSGRSAAAKKWVELVIEDVDPNAFVGLKCKVYWPMDDKWYQGSVAKYDQITRKHKVNYNDDEVEELVLLEEKVKFHVSSSEMQKLTLRCALPNDDKNGLNYNEMLALAASFDDCQSIEPGDLVWAKLTGHAMWPALVVDETKICTSKELKPAKTRSIIVQFFGTHDFARINLKQSIPFLNGLLSSLHLKCKQTSFYKSLVEAKLFLGNQELPKCMLQLQKNANFADFLGTSRDDSRSTEDLSDDELTRQSAECTRTPVEIGNLCVISLGKIISDSEHFHSKQHIWPVGYTALRKFISLKDSGSLVSYKMEVLRDSKSRSRPLFRVTTADGEQIDGPNPNYCWREIYRRLGDLRLNAVNGDVEGCDLQKPGSYMFGFSHPQIAQLIQSLPNSRSCSKYFESCRDMPVGYRAVRVDWKDLDRCSVCHMDEEYEDNLFLQCDKCRMMVHARCYGETDVPDGVLWLCNLCRPGAPKVPPPCCLCPVVGGAMKPTTDGRWAHLTCAMWIPETCLLDVKKMEPIDGLSRINKDRWKLLCSICGVSYGACIQCSNSTCRVAYHPLCARAADLCVELEDEDKLHLMSLDEDDDQCIRLLSFCKRHRQPSNERSSSEENLTSVSQSCSLYVPLNNPSGCARSEPYNSFGRRGQKEPQVLAAASVKRSYVENTPHVVAGYCQNGFGSALTSTGLPDASSLASLMNMGTSSHASVENIFSVVEKYTIMKATYRKRLAFGKSKIHGFGVFSKVQHKAGDMVIEYTGELVRPPIADMREHFFYNSLVGAGTYLFRIDDERVIDATRAGSIAHLINHSCEPNCYSRVISVHGDEHIIIFAKRDINQWEELTYDYRFFSIDEQLACYCGFPKCRKVVNDMEAEEQVAKIRVPKSELIHWRGE